MGMKKSVERAKAEMEKRNKPKEVWVYEVSWPSCRCEVLADSFQIVDDRLIFFCEKDIVAVFREWDSYVRLYKAEELKETSFKLPENFGEVK